MITLLDETGATIIRKKSRKPHRCGGAPGPKEVRAASRHDIPAGSSYVEYLGESGAYESGYHYCFEHAAAQGLIRVEA